MHLRAWFFVVLLLCLHVAAADTTCSATKRCENGCCNKFGNCGFGPDYCEKAVCRSDCDRKSECPGDFEDKWAKKTECPLNVCCSKHGYCGTTKDFCGSKPVPRPECKKRGDMERVVGYFEGWAKNRPCEVFWPEQIPSGLYTHINFAFGTINPNTFLIEANEPEDKDMYERLMLLKKKDKNLKIYLAIGGWTFNDPGPTAKVFSDLALSSARQRHFFDSVMSFMATHKFDGLDLDWEYPVAEERAGREADYKNFPVFMAALKEVMETGNKGLTITLPASYWYLQYFDIKKLEPTVDFFNIMSYDLHGAWDQNVNWTKPYLNAHTNLTEIDSALDLLWRNDIQPNKVVMGLSFYGRAFTAASAACRKPGCLFSSPANAGSCSREKGILLNSEIDKEIKNRNLKPELYKEEAVKVVTWGKQWVSYDDAETLKMKVDHAEKRCLGGVMVWAISHDTKEAKYNKALAKVLGRKVTSGSLDDDEKASEIVKKPYEQCRWSNCKESCPKGWVHVGRLDPDARKDELMYDETGCGDDGHHSFCCPADEDIPQCGWWGHDDGDCQSVSECPSAMVEIGTNSKYCEKSTYVQTACCKTDTKSMRVYDTCRWGDYPECNTSPECPGDYYSWPMASSGSGSGALKCNDKVNDFDTPILGVQMRNYCCSVKPDLRFIDCQVFRDVGPAPKDVPPGFCRSGCPNDRVRVALDTAFHTCTAENSGQATCCKTEYYSEVLEPTEKYEAYKKAMADWVENETCPNPKKVFTKRGLSSPSSTELAVRDDKVEDITIDLMLKYILADIGSPIILDAITRIWDDAVEYTYLQITYISNYIRQNWLPQWEGPSQMAIDILCYPLYWAKEIEAFLTGDKDAKGATLNCTYGYCDEEGNCENLSEGDSDNSPELKSRHATLFGRHSNRFSHLHHHRDNRHLLEARGSKKIHIKDPDDDPDADAHEYNVEVPDNPTVDTIATNNKDNPLLQKIVEIRIPHTCWAPNVFMRPYTAQRIVRLQIEHLLDKNILETFFKDSVYGKYASPHNLYACQRSLLTEVARLKSGATSKYGPIPIIFWDSMDRIDLAEEPGVPDLPGGGSSDDLQLAWIMDRAFECLGSARNDQVFVIAAKDINDAKNHVMRFFRTVGDRNLEKYMTREGKSEADIKRAGETVTSRMRAGFSVFWYMGLTPVKDKFKQIVKDVHVQFKFAESVYNKKHPNEKVQLADYWIEWITNYYAQVVKKFKENVTDQIAEVRALLDGVDDDEADGVRYIMDQFETQLENAFRIRIDTSGFPTFGDGDTEMGGT
ncbi:hypothetical protein FSARC_3410 [Fusarium sarcochroum]|uniref:chitinase n=1 Tax=Fusarium sarcochroum TaxID=1208366 RepID=A0A8H4XCH7_9HYPO|nr:hypothetical protein FSARC_3410 [Fusarium sarcochroum]